MWISGLMMPFGLVWFSVLTVGGFDGVGMVLVVLAVMFWVG